MVYQGQGILMSVRELCIFCQESGNYLGVYELQKISRIMARSFSYRLNLIIEKVIRIIFSLKVKQIW